MYILISPQVIKPNSSNSVSPLVAYLEKENDNVKQELFFNQYEDEIPPEEVISGIDNNASKLGKDVPRFYSMVVSPSSEELQHLKNDPAALKTYTRELMHAYASCFNREINGRMINVNDIKYYAKIEQQRTYKHTDLHVRENQAFNYKIRRLESDLRKIDRGDISGDKHHIQKHIQRLETATPHKLDGKRIMQGMYKEGRQSHVHLILSRKDATNSVSLSPGSKYKASNIILHGRLIKRGFGRDAFYDKAEKTFDRTFAYQRNFVESYQSRKDLIKDPKKYYSALYNLPKREKEAAFDLLRKSGVSIPKIPTSIAQMGLRSFKKSISLVKNSAAIEI